MSKVKLGWLYAVVILELIAIAGLITWVLIAKPDQKPPTHITKPVSLNQPQVLLSEFAKGLSKPTNIVASTDPTDQRLFVTEQEGKVMTVDQQGKLEPQAFMDLSGKVMTGGETGLLGLAFHPKYTQNGYFYVNYIDKNQNTVIARYSVSQQTKLADPASEKVLIKLKQPFANHNGGNLQFGPDGYLYLGLGDGGSSGDPQGNGQKKDTFLGKILRIDVDHGNPYSVPATNPFASQKDYKPEIWALGLRNPWRFSFDKTTGDLYIADVGQGNIEEIDFQPGGDKGGQNYGWRCYEGTVTFNTSGCADSTAFTLPVIDYDHSNKRCSVTGGYVYRGSTEQALTGKYFFGDYCGGQVYYASRQNGKWVSVLAASTPYAISTFGQDQVGNLYLADYASGTILRLSDSAN